MRKAFTDLDYESIISSRLIFNKPIPEIAKEMDCGETVIYNVGAIFKCVQQKDIDRACDMIRKGYSADCFQWAYRRLGFEVPKQVFAAIEERKEINRQQNLAAVAKKEAAEKPVEPEKKPEQKNDAIYFCKLLEAVNKQNELLTQLMDVVIPKWVGDMKDNVNANSDMLQKQLKDIGDKAEGIKINTRKRGI